MGHYWGIDLGGTKIEAVAIHQERGSGPVVLARHRVATQAHLGYEAILDQIATLLDTIEGLSGLYCPRVGIGTPGTLDPATGLLKNSNTLCLNGKPLQKDLQTLLDREVRIANDANCFALAETLWGAVASHFPQTPEVVFGIIMGTGVGGGIVINGHVLQGTHGIAGEWGHNVLEEGGAPCYCGKSGCVEAVLSGKALESWYMTQSGQNKSLPDIIADAAYGADAHAQATVERMHTYFGKALGTLINVLDPAAIVIGGGVGNISSLYTKGVAQMHPWTFHPTPVQTQILKPLLGDSAGVFGAALL